MSMPSTILWITCPSFPKNFNYIFLKYREQIIILTTRRQICQHILSFFISPLFFHPSTSLRLQVSSSTFNKDTCMINFLSYYVSGKCYVPLTIAWLFWNILNWQIFSFITLKNCFPAHLLLIRVLLLT